MDELLSSSKNNVKIDITGIILAGGTSSRMGMPKAFVKVGGVPIIERETRALHEVFEEVVVVAKDPVLYVRAGYRALPDARRFDGISGPLRGVYSGLSAIDGDYAFVVACDMPFINPGLVGWMAGLAGGGRLLIPDVDGYIEPLFGFYPKSALLVFEKALARGVRRLSDVFADLDIRFVRGGDMREYDPDLLSLVNVNTPDDLARAEELLARGVF